MWLQTLLIDFDIHCFTCKYVYRILWHLSVGETGVLVVVLGSVGVEMQGKNTRD